MSRSSGRQKSGADVLFWFLALPTLSTVLTVHTQSANRDVFGVLKSHNRTLSAWIIVKTSGVLSPRLIMDSEPLTFQDLHKFVIYLNSNKITLQLNTKFVKFNSLTSELLVFNLNDSFQCTSNVHEHSVLWIRVSSPIFHVNCLQIM